MNVVDEGEEVISYMRFGTWFWSILLCVVHGHLSAECFWRIKSHYQQRHFCHPDLDLGLRVLRCECDIDGGNC